MAKYSSHFSSVAGLSISKSCINLYLLVSPKQLVLHQFKGGETQTAVKYFSTCHAASGDLGGFLGRRPHRIGGRQLAAFVVVW